MGVEFSQIEASDCVPIVDAFRLQGWNKQIELYERYLEESRLGVRRTVLAKVGGEICGYVTLKWLADYLPFRKAGIPEIQDLNVLMKFRRKGIGSVIMDEAERLIMERSPLRDLGWRWILTMVQPRRCM